MKKYLKVWLFTTSLSIQTAFENRSSALFYLTGKTIRFTFFILLLIFIHRQVKVIAGYSLDQMITFYLVFNVFDIFGQTFFRGIYWFRNLVISGEFDFRLVKPIDSLFQVLTRHTDILDVPLFIITILMLMVQNSNLSITQVPVVIIMILTGMLIVTAIHIFVAALGVITTEVDHAIMIYRDLSAMARFPIDIYADWLRGFLSFVIPIAIAYTFPAKAILGLLSLPAALGSLAVGVSLLLLAFKAWHLSLRRYSSASS